MNSSLWSWQQTRTSPNGCYQCGEQERGHTESHDYVAPNDALRLARMRARREARLNPPDRAETPPDLVATITANAGDWEDASRYLLRQLREPRMRRSSLTLRPPALPSRPPETASERVEALLAHGGYVAPVQAISTPGPNEPSIYTVRPGTDHPARMRIGDGDWVPCRVVGFDMTRDGDGTMVSGQVGEDGRLHLDGAYRPNIEFDAQALGERMAELGRFFRDMGHAMADSLAPAGVAAASAARQLAARLDPELEAARHWEAQGRVCCHVCGPDPGHVCDAKAVTTLRHALPSGGVRDLPLCGPCNLAEASAPSVPN